jgi:cysteine desulfurase
LIFRQNIKKECALKPIIIGGGQENGFRAGTLPVHLIVGFGKACEIATKNNKKWIQYCYAYKQELLSAFQKLNPVLNGSLDRCMPNVLNVSFPGINSEAAMVALKDIVAISNGSACTSSFYHKSYVLESMKLDESTISEALRFSWCHLTPRFDFTKIPMRLKQLS